MHSEMTLERDLPRRLAVFDHRTGIKLLVVRMGEEIFVRDPESVLVAAYNDKPAGSFTLGQSVFMARRIAMRGPSIGHYSDAQIHEWIEMADGSRWKFAGVCGDYLPVDRLAAGMIAVMPGLLYTPSAAAPEGAR